MTKVGAHALIKQHGRIKSPAKNYSAPIAYRVIDIGRRPRKLPWTGRMHAFTHACMRGSVGKRLNWSDYPLVHKEIAASIS
jgi:hypothetical protein